MNPYNAKTIRCIKSDLKLMRKLIETYRYSQVVCDNKECNYSVVYSPDVPLIYYLDMPCPKCGQNLLTPEDYIQSRKILKMVN